MENFVTNASLYQVVNTVIVIIVSNVFAKKVGMDFSVQNVSLIRTCKFCCCCRHRRRLMKF